MSNKNKAARVEQSPGHAETTTFSEAVTVVGEESKTEPLKGVLVLTHDGPLKGVGILR